MAIENKYGMKYFSGAAEDHTAVYFNSIDEAYHNKEVYLSENHNNEEIYKYYLDLIKKFNGDNTGNKLLIIDSKNVFEGTLENLKQMDLGYEFEVTNEDLKFEDVKQKIEDKEIKEAIIINPENEKIMI